MLIKSNWTRNEEANGEKPIDVNDLSDPKRIAHITLEPGVEDAWVSWLWHTWPCIEYQGTQRSPALLLLLFSKTMFECRSCVIHAARPVSPIPFPDICNPVYIYIYTVDRCFRDNKARFPICLFRTIRRNEHSCSLSCSWFTISLQPVLRKRYLEPFVRSFGRKSDRELDNDKFVIVS